MNQHLIQALDDLDSDWASDTEVIQGSNGDLKGVKITLQVGGRKRTGLAPVLYDSVSETLDAVDEATQKAFAQAASQFGIVAPQ